MKLSGCPASEGMFSISAMPFSPWHAAQGSARSLPAAMGSAASAAAATSAAAARTAAKALLRKADAIDRARVVVGDEERAVLGDGDVRGPAEILVAALEPALGEDLLLR